MNKSAALCCLAPLSLALCCATHAATTSQTKSAATINFGTRVAIQGRGVKRAGDEFTISAAGSYQLTGMAVNARVIVDAPDADVTLVLRDLQLSSDLAPIEIRHAEQVTLELARGTQNQLTERAGAACSAKDNELNAVVYSHEDLLITGDGSLVVQGQCAHGVVSKDSLKIQSGTLSVTALKDGLKGKDAVHIKGGQVTVNAGSDGIVATNDKAVDKGRIVIDSGTVAITAAHDTLQAAGTLTINGGVVKLVAGGGAGQAKFKLPRDRRWPGATQADADVPSKRGLKAAHDIVVNAGKIVINAADDALHAKQQIRIAGGELQIETGDDALHAEQALLIQGGSVEIASSYEGLESRQSITVSGGIVHLRADDDGINVASGSDGWGPMRGSGASTSEPSFVMTGGYVSVDSGGDGIDINASASMSGGTLVVNGPTSNRDGPLDYDGSFQVSGGTVVASGSAGMAQAPSNFSTQHSVSVFLNSMQAAGTPLRIVDVQGHVVLNAAPLKPYQSLVLSTPELIAGQSYVVYIGGEFSGQATDGIYTKAAEYQMGEELGRFTVTDTVSYVGGSRGGFGGFGGWGRGMGGR